MKKVAVLTVLLSSFVSVPSWAEASENIYKFACGNKTLSLYESSNAMFVDKTKADDLDVRSVTNGAVVNFRLYAEMGDLIPNIKCPSSTVKRNLAANG